MTQSIHSSLWQLTFSVSVPCYLEEQLMPHKCYYLTISTAGKLLYIFLYSELTTFLHKIYPPVIGWLYKHFSHLFFLGSRSTWKRSCRTHQISKKFSFLVKVGRVGKIKKKSALPISRIVKNLSDDQVLP